MTAGSPEPASSRSPASAHSWQRVIREVAADRVARRVFTLTALLVGFAYSLVLPFDYTPFALGMAWLLALQVHAARRVAASAIDGARQAGRAGPVAVLVLSVLWSTRKLTRAACLQQQSCTPSPALGIGATGQHAARDNPNAPSRTGMRHG